MDTCNNHGQVPRDAALYWSTRFSFTRSDRQASIALNSRVEWYAVAASKTGAELDFGLGSIKRDYGRLEEEGGRFIVAGGLRWCGM